MNLGSIISNPWVGFIGTALGTIGVLLSIVFYLRSRRVQGPARYSMSINWYDDKSAPHGDIKLMFKGKVIPRFTITHLLFWNAGNQTIRKSDFAPASPLRLTIPAGTGIFDLAITAVTAKEIGASIELPNNYSPTDGAELPIQFDYLDQGDGFSIRVIHDSPKDHEIQIVGKLPGVADFHSSGSFIRQASMIPAVKGLAIPVSSPLYKYIFIPLGSFALGTAGAWSIYDAIFVEFHGYHIFTSLFVIYLFIPFVLLNTKFDPPRALLKSLSPQSRVITSTEKSPA